MSWVTAALAQLPAAGSGSGGFDVAAADENGGGLDAEFEEGRAALQQAHVAG